nr:PREDICTED: gamma-aminobutyric acid receptor alpha-like isoform X2 [Bemisia tabaci]
MCSAPNNKMLIPLLVVVVWIPPGMSLTDQLRAFGANVTNVLDNMLSPASYNKNIRPNIKGNPVTISVNMYIKSIGAISDNDEEFTMDLYFRQSWLDSRLKFRLHGVEEISMSWLFVDKVWKPDTFFMNGKKSSLHKITSPNKFVRLRKNGYLTLSMRLTVSASCKMHLRKFPLDTQNCSLLIGSFAYASSDIIYKWSADGEPVATEPGMEMAQHSLIATKIQKNFLVKRDTDEYHVIRANFIFQRSIGFFVLQVYVPCALIICCSWVSFWINPDDVPARIQLDSN